ncbi:hypothetical protein NBO_11g0050 [Nosema bombycis CQ1]|uniref:Uncharacterized protein n=1 Tax=Nosema bombycis (strain CQ1 / CVCC 102059) TaxID=578461 RepID=R0MAK0_NOSB1|nr:hypothetical protein NBO_11g0050 [Nosema bombycis CQ1]|eukprot:EOB14979.1 hypothetical protein NBO_11g0050 [Nosema bombycis CQ1]
MKKLLKEIYAPDLHKIHEILEKQSQICICGTDIQILKVITETLSKSYKKILNLNLSYDFLKDTSNLLCIMNLGEVSGLLSSKLLYYYLEQSVVSSTKVLLYTNNCSSLDSLERRIKSRFKDNIYILRNLTFDEYKGIYYKIKDDCIISIKDGDMKGIKGIKRKGNMKDIKGNSKVKDTDITTSDVKLDNNTFIDSLLLKQYNISPLLIFLNQIKIKNQFKIPSFDIFSLLNPIHLSLLILFLNVKGEYNTIVREFKKFTSKFKELKNVKDEEILNYYYDLLDFGFINEKGLFLYSEYELKEYIGSKGTMYLKKMLKGI